MFQIKQKDELSKLKGKDMEKGRKTNYVRSNHSNKNLMWKESDLQIPVKLQIDDLNLPFGLDNEKIARLGIFSPRKEFFNLLDDDLVGFTAVI